MQKSLSAFTLAMIAVAGIVNLRSLPLMASYGEASLFYYLLAGLTFLLPSALVCAELSTGWPRAGGVYLWIREAFGSGVGFWGMWLEWINNVISLPATLSFMATAIAYLLQPSWIENKHFIFMTMMIVLWGGTLFNFLGIQMSSKLNVVGALFGTIVPGLVIAGLAVWWLLSGAPTQLHFSWHALLPHGSFDSMVFFIGVLSGYAGMQIIAFHAPDVKNPERAFPRAIFAAVIMILLVTVMGSLGIAMVVPKEQITLLGGLLQGFTGFLSALHLEWAFDGLVILILLAGFSSLSAWLLGPARGMQAAAEQGDFPRHFAKVNRFGAPVNILLLQALIGSVFAFAFLLMPSLSSAFWLLMVLTSQFTLLMYILMFASVIKLRHSQPTVLRAYRIPGGNVGLWLVCGVPILVCIGALALSFVPPAELKVASTKAFSELILICDAVYLIIPIVINFATTLPVIARRASDVAI